MQMLLANIFGTSVEADAYFVASTIPTLLATVFTGSLNIAFVPIFIEYQSRFDNKEAWRVASGLISITTVILSLVVAVGLAISKWLVFIVAPGYFNNTFFVELTQIL
ncbi:MAG: murein biosynthesis integral membrane protein MurJ, partial [Phycisphaerae bacterium]|nr:murein biosynthesis integral membrane protein MurJ [Phycisphaerae bacterium]NIX30232.1 murein biosynthesis integral membrane protein MurJ [Phycisphaerae bacterium]